MAKNWYLLKVRSGFQKAVVRKLRKQGLEVFVPRQKPGDPQRGYPHPSIGPADYVYCRFAPEDRQSVTAVPGVLDILQKVANPLNDDQSLC